MRRLVAVSTVVSAAAVLVVGCSSTSSPVGGSSSVVTTAASTTLPVTSAPSSTPPSSTTSSPTSSKKAGEPLPDAAAVLEEASATTAGLDSVHLTMAVSGDIENMPITALDGDVTRHPEAAAKGYAKIAYRGAPAFVKFVVFGGDLYVSQAGGPWVDYGPAAHFYDPAAILSPDTGLADMLIAFIDPEVQQRETVNDVQTVRITGEVAADAAKKIVPQLHAGKRTSCTVWIEETGDHHLVRLDLASGADDSVRMTFSNWNAPVSVGKPRLPRPPG